ncbi:radical SAM protein [bacterium]|nr:radical SAM protein [candidate division CSSED10-310 bacterium]
MKISSLYQWANLLHAGFPRACLNGYAFPPLRVGCVLTHRCNLRCAMCFVWKHGNRELAAQELSTGEWKRIIDQIPGQAIITFTGGEPLVRADLTELLEHACRNHRVHLVSNGTLFDPELIETCLKLAPSSLLGKGLVSVGVSLEGPQEVHDAMVQVPGAFERTTDTLRQFATRKKNVHQRFPLLDLKIVICRETHGSLVALYDLAEAIGLDLISYQQCSTQESSYGIDASSENPVMKAPPPVTPIPRDALLEELSELTARAAGRVTELRFNPPMDLSLFADRYENRFPLKRASCTAAWSIMHIGPYGTVFPCFSIPMGDLRTQSLKEIWNGKPYREFRRKLKKSRIFPGCIGCCVMKISR